MHPVITVFIASPSDCTKERELAERAVQKLAPRLVKRFGIALVPLRWEQFAPISSYDGSHPQVTILRQIKPLSIFVGIVEDTCGTPISPGGETGIELEFEYVQQLRPRVPILSYFRERRRKSKGTKNAEASQRVDKLEAELRDQNVLRAKYRDHEEFGNRIPGDLMEAVLELVLTREPREVGDYLEFFKFGTHPRLGALPVMIVYPPMTDPGPGHHSPRLNWQERLLPHVIYEDFKAIQDVEEANAGWSGGSTRP